MTTSRSEAGGNAAVELELSVQFGRFDYGRSAGVIVRARRWFAELTWASARMRQRGVRLRPTLSYGRRIRHDVPISF